MNESQSIRGTKIYLRQPAGMSPAMDYERAIQ
jgi:hypothetical protein